MRQQVVRFVLIGHDLYRQGYTRPLLKCISPNQADYVMREIHEGVCENHSGARMMVAKIQRADNY